MNIRQMYGNTVHINKLRTAGYGEADFDTEIMPLWTTTRQEAYRGTEVEGQQRPMQMVVGKVVSVRPDTGHVLGIHGNRYKAVNHKSMIDMQRSIIARSDLDAAGIRERIVTANHGARAYVTHELHNQSITTPDGDKGLSDNVKIFVFFICFLMGSVLFCEICSHILPYMIGDF